MQLVVFVYLTSSIQNDHVCALILANRVIYNLSDKPEKTKFVLHSAHNCITVIAKARKQRFSQ